MSSAAGEAAERPSTDPEGGLRPGADHARPEIALAALAGAALLVLSVPALHWQLGVPVPGLELEPAPDGGLVVTEVAPDGSAANVGVRAGDTLLAVGRVPVAGREGGPPDPELVRHEVMNRHREGERATWTVARDGRRVELTGSFVGIRDGRVVSRAVVLGVFWLLAWFLLWARPDRKDARHLVYTIFASTASVLFVVNRVMALDTPLGFTLVQVSNLGLFAAPALVIHFGVIFPATTLSDRARRRLLASVWGLYFVAVYVVQQGLVVRGLLSSGAPYLLVPDALEAIRYLDLNVWLHVGQYVVCAGLILWSYRRLEEERLRDQVKWVLWAVGLTAALDALGMGAALYAEGVAFSDLYPYRNYLYLLIAAGLLVAIFRHDLFDVDRVIRGTVVYFGTVSVLFVLFAATEALVTEALKTLVPTRSDLAGTASAAVLAGVLFQPLRSWIRAKMLELLPVDPEEEVLGEAR